MQPKTDAVKTSEPEQLVVPMLAYADASAAISFLCEAFGFKERFRMAMDDGRIGHAELTYGDNVVMLASAWREAGFASPMELSGIHTQLYCSVDDVDGHYRRAFAAGATIISEPSNQPYGRVYRAVDLEGHRWIFGSSVPGSSAKTKDRVPD